MDYVKNPMGIAEKAMRDYGVDIMSMHDVVMGPCASTFGAGARALGSSSQTHSGSLHRRLTPTGRLTERLKRSFGSTHGHPSDLKVWEPCTVRRDFAA